MTAGSILQTLFVAVSVGAGSAAAQALTLASVVSGSPMRMVAEADDAQAVSPEIALGADVTAGFALTAAVPFSHAQAVGTWGFEDQRFRAQLYANATGNGAVASGVAAHTGTPSVIVQLTLSRPMVLRFVASVGVQSFGVAPRGVIDVGDDGVAEVDFTSPAGLCELASKTVVLDLPAGSFPVRLSVEADVPSGILPGNCLIASATATLLVEPAHVDVGFEGVPCGGGGISVTPMLDGESVRFFFGEQVLLVFGTSPAQVTLPFAPGCSLLVAPDVVMWAPMASWLVLPLAHLGPVDLLAQAVTYRPTMWWQPPGPPHVASSERVVLHVR
jgi:hypothetical protein